MHGDRAVREVADGVGGQINGVFTPAGVDSCGPLDKVAAKEWEDRAGYMYGTTTIAGADGFKGHTLKVWFKNENHISWLDDKPYVTSPDMICLLSPGACQ